MLMKKTFRMLGSLTIAAALATVLGACSSDDSLVDSSLPETTTPARGVTVTVGAGIADDAVTRSAVVSTTDDETGKTTRMLTFTTGDRLYVYGSIDDGYVAGMLTMVGEPTNDGMNATFTGELTAYEKVGSDFNPNYEYEFEGDPLDGTTATLVHESMKYEENSEDNDYFYYYGDIFFNYGYAKDLMTLMTKRLKVTGEYNAGGYTLANNDEAIFNCTFTGLNPGEKYELSLQYEREPNNMVGLFNYSFTTDKYGTGTIAFTSKEVGEQSWEINIKEVGIIKLYDPNVGKRELEAGKIYNVRRWWNGTAFASPTNLADITDDYVAQNGEILTGTLGAAHKISIADGATVMLAGVTIDGKTLNSEDYWEYNWAGLTCLGNANIVLNGENTVTSFCAESPCIQAGPEGTTLTISGSGKLTAKSNSLSAGIGGGILNCGDITISGGDITASSRLGAGIGSGGEGTCGAITINGGTVTASSNEGACIGSGEEATCGAITITGCTVTATNNNSGAAIGCGRNGHCGAITIDKGNEDYINVKAESNIIAKPIGLSYNSQCGKITIGGCVLYDPDAVDPDRNYDIRNLMEDGIELNVYESEDQVWYVKSFWD